MAQRLRKADRTRGDTAGAKAGASEPELPGLLRKRLEELVNTNSFNCPVWCNRTELFATLRLPEKALELPKPPENSKPYTLNPKP